MFNHDMGYTNPGLLGRLCMQSKSDRWNILVEDVGREYEYDTILGRLLGSDTDFIVHAMGGKTGVIAAFNAISAGDVVADSLGEIYLVDGDFDFLTCDNGRFTHKSFIHLDRYDIENYFIDFNAIESCIQNKVRDTRDVVKRIVALDSWYNSVTSGLHKLFALFFLVQKNGLGTENSKLPSSRFIPADKGGAFSETEYDSYYSEIMGHFEEPEIFEMDLKACEETIKHAVGQNFGHIVSGKYYLWSLILYLKDKDLYKTKNNDFRWWLINNFDIESLAWLRERILSIIVT